MIPVEKLLQPLAGDDPCGEDLEYDASRVKLMDTDIQGTPERQVGEEVIEAEDPNWGKIKDQCVELLERSKDLEVAVALSAAVLERGGLAGFREGLALLEGYVTQFWDGFYPKLDMDEAESERYDLRLNCLQNLSAAYKTIGDPFRIVERLRKTPLVESRSAGRITLGEIRASEAGGADAPTGEFISGVFGSVEETELADVSDSVAGCLSSISVIEGYLSENLGNQYSPNLDNLKDELKGMQQAFAKYGPVEEEIEPEAEEDGGESSGGGRPAGGQRISGEISSRDDVIKTLEKIIGYYGKYEPTSPLPFMLKRAQKLVKADFMEIIANLQPGSRDEFNNVLDIQDDE